MKPLLVFYVGVGLYSSEDDVEAHISNQIKNVSELKDDYSMIFIPTRGHSSTKVECINPIFLPKDFYEKYMLKYEGKIVCKIKELENAKAKLSD